MFENSRILAHLHTQFAKIQKKINGVKTNFVLISNLLMQVCPGP
jgi:hypothetical protein